MEKKRATTKLGRDQSYVQKKNESASLDEHAFPDEEEPCPLQQLLREMKLKRIAEETKTRFMAYSDTNNVEVGGEAQRRFPRPDCLTHQDTGRDVISKNVRASSADESSHENKEPPCPLKQVLLDEMRIKILPAGDDTSNPLQAKSLTFEAHDSSSETRCWFKPAVPLWEPARSTREGHVTAIKEHKKKDQKKVTIKDGRIYRTHYYQSKRGLANEDSSFGGYSNGAESVSSLDVLFNWITYSCS